MGIPVEAINKIGEGSPHVVDWIESGDVDLVVNTPTGSGARTDGWEIRRAAVARGHPVHHDAVAAAWRRRARSPPARHGEPTVLSLQELHRRRRKRVVTFGRRRVGTRRRSRAARRRLRRARRRRPDGPAPRAGPVLHARRRRALGRRRGRAPVPAARVLGACAPRDGPAGVHARGRRPGNAPAVRARREGDGLWLAGPLGQGFARRGRPAPGARRRRRRDRRRWRRWPDAARTAPRRSLLGFRDADARRGAPRCSPARQRGDRRRLASATTGSSPSCSPPSSTRRRTPRSTPAGRPRCSRRCGRSARLAACPRSSRSSPGWPAASAPASAASSRCAAAATCGSASTARCSTPPQLAEVPAH